MAVLLQFLGPLRSFGGAVQVSWQFFSSTLAVLLWSYLAKYLVFSFSKGLKKSYQGTKENWDIMES